MLRTFATTILLLIPTAVGAGTTVCRPTFNDLFEFECREKEGVKNAASFCDVMNRQGGPIMWSRNDTNETKNRADLVNSVGKRLCGWGKK